MVFVCSGYIFWVKESYTVPLRHVSNLVFVFLSIDLCTRHGGKIMYASATTYWPVLVWLYYVELFVLFLMECGHVYQCMQLTFFPFKVKIYEANTNILFLLYTTSHNYIILFHFYLIKVIIKVSLGLPDEVHRDMNKYIYIWYVGTFERINFIHGHSVVLVQ